MAAVSVYALRHIITLMYRGLLASRYLALPRLRCGVVSIAIVSSV